eukprot:CAMPEP_0201722042 /NCGR_PEP_ID=MMETSP0593-20130828/6530_1 /ASSEMBLY_ACC=CAM_ASM_000672 /TAXON_ID=267983 /ORGANISM="Skeletonema japonicum, Strain CCMP2506" /LENGTH=291 /DNA_ID=CAMNT_0048212943 /DNA_START=43 /DNA_END=918 /DNA_ORIENTATION=-
MLDVEAIRHLAQQHCLAEVQFNDTSRVIAFERSTPLPCRINVYYTTGTVATCINHPRSGKTQLFRRNQTLDDLGAIFANPRQHTGVGYYRRNGGEKWQPVDTLGRQMDFRREECDDARRWRFIHSTQEGFCNESQANQIAALCNLWNQLRFAPGHGIMTTADKFNSMSPSDFHELNNAITQAGYSPISICADCDDRTCRCSERIGSWCCLLRVVLKVARDRDIDGVEVLIKGLDDNSDDGIDMQSAVNLMNCSCNDGDIFQQRHAAFFGKTTETIQVVPHNNSSGINSLVP